MNEAVFESVRKGLSYIERSLCRDIGVRDVADSVSYSQFYFSREFTRYTHQSVYDYIVKRKISESYKRLFREKIRIADLAFLYGFQSHEVYTRAFKKVFHELPSEAVVYKPLAVFEAIGGRYLEFLRALEVEIVHQPCQDCFFVPSKPARRPDGPLDSLVHLDGENPFRVEQTFQGRLTDGETNRLSFRLAGLQTVVRIHHSDISHCFRYFTEHFFNASELNANYIVLRRAGRAVELLVPTAVQKP